jgi:hypothetical protein
MTKCKISNSELCFPFSYRYRGSTRLIPSSEPSMASSFRSVSSLEFVSTLMLEEVTRKQSGNYTCMPSNAKAASVRLHVIDGKEFIANRMEFC